MRDDFDEDRDTELCEACWAQFRREELGEDVP